MINLKNLKTLFVTEEGTVNTSSPKEKKVEVSVQDTPPPISVPSNDTPPVMPPKIVEPPKEEKREVNPRMMQRLVGAIESNNMEGFDYLEFKSSVKALSHLPLDEATRYQSAYATAAATMGLTTDKLLKTANYYKGVLSKEKDKFKVVLENQVNEHILGREKERQNVEANIQQKHAQIAQLQQEIAQYQSQLEKLQGQIDDIQCKIEATKNDFIHAYQLINVNIDNDINKIKQYLT